MFWKYAANLQESTHARRHFGWWLWTSFTPCSSVSIVNFEQVIGGGILLDMCDFSYCSGRNFCLPKWHERMRTWTYFVFNFEILLSLRWESLFTVSQSTFVSTYRFFFFYRGICFFKAYFIKRPGPEPNPGPSDKLDSRPLEKADFNLNSLYSLKLIFDKSERADFKYDNSFQISTKKYPRKTILVLHLKIIVFCIKLYIKKTRQFFQIPV